MRVISFMPPQITPQEGLRKMLTEQVRKTTRRRQRPKVQVGAAAPGIVSPGARGRWRVREVAMRTASEKKDGDPPILAVGRPEGVLFQKTHLPQVRPLVVMTGDCHNKPPSS